MDETSASQQQDPTVINQSKWRAVTALFDRCSGLTPEQLEQLLADADPALASEVRSLLQFADPEQSNFQNPVDDILSPPQSLPEQIGPYRVERLLGEGGMGSVFLARRVGEFDQLVAVKLIRRDFGTASHAMELRFRLERQILASLQHPNIAHLLDGGTSDARPYLVVEYVPGVRIDEYCSHNQLSIKQRIELFLKICAAVQYAHQNLIVHRDLKPANVLVLDDSTPKLLDFGIAKLMRDDDNAQDLTHTAMKIFTPSYASPEQLLGKPVGTASDVYSLGVMLYELLTGQKPHLLDTQSDLAMLDAVCRQTPPSASAAIKRYSEDEREERAAERKTTYPGWGRVLRNDLDLILSRSISADVTRRYQSVEQFASDLTRYLARLPIAARKDTWGYRTRKFCSRHTSLVAVTSGAIVLLLVAGLALWREARIAIQQEQRAERRYNDLRSLARSNITEVQTALDHVQGGTEVRALILGRALKYLDSLAAENESDIDLQRDLAQAYLMLAQRLGNPASANIGDIAGANADYDKSIRIRESIVALPQATEKDRFLLLYVRYHKSLMLFNAGQLEAARQNLAQAASASDAILAGNPHDLTQALNSVQLTHRALADILFENGAAPSLGDPVQGLHHAGIALQAAEMAFARNPKDAELRANLISAKDTRADLMFAAGREDEGLALNKANVDFIKASNDLLLEDRGQLVVYTNYQYGRQLAKKDPRGALPWLEGSLAAVLSARAADPANIKMAQWSAIATTTVGHVHWLAGDHQKGQKMMTDGVAQLTGLIARSSAPSGELRYALAEGHQGLGDAALEDGKRSPALSQYQEAENVYAEDAARIPDDLDVYPKRAENQLSMAKVEMMLGMTQRAADSRSLAIEYIERVLRVHPDNPVAQQMKLKATALRF